MAEKDCQTELMRGFSHFGYHAYKIPDMPHALARQANFVQKKPYDCYAVMAGGFHAMELKQVNKGLTFTLSNIRDHQEDHLLHVNRCGGFGWLVVNFRVRLTSGQKKKMNSQSDVLDRMFVANIRDVVDARIKGAMTGLPIDWFLSNGVELPKVITNDGLAAWDPRPAIPDSGKGGNS